MSFRWVSTAVTAVGVSALSMAVSWHSTGTLSPAPMNPPQGVAFQMENFKPMDALSTDAASKVAAVFESNQQPDFSFNPDSPGWETSVSDVRGSQRQQALARTAALEEAKAKAKAEAAAKAEAKAKADAQSSYQELSGRSGSPTASAIDLGSRVAGAVQQYLGVPYRWGGTSPSGFDCSGLVCYTYARFGVHLGRTSYDQFNEGTAVSRSNLIPGDLVFFSTAGPGASHVGIYIGGGSFVSAAGASVRVSSLYDGYWGGHYVGARRIG